MTRMLKPAARRATSWPMRPKPDEAKRLVANFLAEKLLLLPLTLFHRRVGGGKVTGQRQDQAHRQFGDADAVRARRVHDDDAASAGGGDVDVVDAGARACDDAKRLGSGDELRRHLRGAAHDERVGVGEILRELVGCPASPGVHVPAFGFQKLKCGCGEIVGDNNFHDADQRNRAVFE